MGKWSRQELEEAFDNVQRVTLEAFGKGNLDQWVDLFTEDCTYVEHYYGTFCGREAVRKWFKLAMTPYPATEMKYAPVEWYIIDEERGWVVFQAWSRMSEPGDLSIHQWPYFCLMKYAGHGKWSYEEDMYNPMEAAECNERWEQAKERTGFGRGTPEEFPKTQKQLQQDGGAWPEPTGRAKR
ncbi:MAG: nuclear transport factor 2 family protein [Chloroflexi bacterium]|nr:nuclear transport factor 2 family protein [Chloroflexota bacterium]